MNSVDRFESMMRVDDRAFVGEVTTPVELVNEMIDRIPERIFTSSTTTFCEPCFGNGTFIIELIKRLRRHGHSMSNIETRIYGCEISKRLYNKVWKKLSKYNFNNLQCGDALEHNFNNMKFDVVIGNPPFNETDTTRDNTNFKGQGRNLAKLFTYKAVELSKDIIMFIQPYGHRTLSTQVERFYVENGLNRVVNCKSYFPAVAQSLVYLIFNRSTRVDYVDEMKTTAPIPEDNIAQYFINQPGKLSRFEYEHELKDEGSVKVFVTTGKQGFTDDVDFHRRMQDKSYGKWRTVFNCTTTRTSIGKVLVASPTDVLSKSVHCLAFDTQEEAELYCDYLSNPKTNNILAGVKMGMCNSKKFLQYIPTVKSNKEH